LATGLSLLEEPTRRRALLTALLFGLAAAARPNAALALGALVLVPLATRRGRPSVAILAAAFGAVALYLLIETAFFALGTGKPLASHLELADFQRLQFAENRERYGSVYRPLS